MEENEKQEDSENIWLKPSSEPIDFSKVYDFGNVSLSDRFKPITLAQSEINNSVLTGAIDFGSSTTGRLSFDTVNDSVIGLQNFAVTSGVLGTTATYNYTANPVYTTLASAAANISEVQSSILSGSGGSRLLYSDTGLADSIVFNPSTISLSALSIDALNRSSYLTTPTKTKSEVDEKLEKIQSELEKLKEQKKKEVAAKANEKIAVWLEGMSPSLNRFFKAAVRVFYDQDNEDRVGQSAESFTRLIETLPDYLCKDTDLESLSTPNRKKEAVKRYLIQTNKYTEEYKKLLSEKQEAFYIGFSEIRHDEVRKKYDEDPAVYEALLFDVESWIVALIAANE